MPPQITSVSNETKELLTSEIARLQARLVQIRTQIVPLDALKKEYTEIQKKIEAYKLDKGA